MKVKRKSVQFFYLAPFFELGKSMGYRRSEEAMAYEGSGYYKRGNPAPLGKVEGKFSFFISPQFFELRGAQKMRKMKKKVFFQLSLRDRASPDLIRRPPMLY